MGRSTGGLITLRTQPRLREDCSPAIFPFSTTTTGTPRSARHSAVDRPTIPPPMTTTLVWLGQLANVSTGSILGAICSSFQSQGNHGSARRERSKRDREFPHLGL